MPAVGCSAATVGEGEYIGGAAGEWALGSRGRQGGARARRTRDGWGAVRGVWF